ncbi:MAG: bifunctional hydroxymethylpyrimidine kinase/phosphomethylpyrimidine kinase [Candidatus Micrarchaeota archaeon]
MNLLIISASDPDGGAGVGADIRTASVLGVHPLPTISAITSQNTRATHSVFPVPKAQLEAQLNAVLEDVRVDAVKIGLLGSAENTRALARILKKHKLKNIVLDPVSSAQADEKELASAEAVSALRELLPLVSLITPNAREAEQLTGVKVSSVDEAKTASKKLVSMGAESALIKGIREGDEVVDVLLFNGSFSLFKKQRAQTHTHGGGCCFSTAIASNLALLQSLPRAVEEAEEFIDSAIANSFKLGKGIELVSPEALSSTEKQKIISNVREALALLESSKGFAPLIPEIGTNIGYALPNARSPAEVAAVVGRIRNAEGTARSLGIVCFGTSSHIARSILRMMEFDKEKRAALNIRYSSELVEKCEKLGWKIESYSRASEPKEIKEKEGSSVQRGVSEALKRHLASKFGSKAANAMKKANGASLDAIFHLGDIGKEPVIIIFGKDAVDAAKRSLLLL